MFSASFPSSTCPHLLCPRSSGPGEHTRAPRCPFSSSALRLRHRTAAGRLRGHSSRGATPLLPCSCSVFAVSSNPAVLAPSLSIMLYLFLCSPDPLCHLLLPSVSPSIAASVLKAVTWYIRPALDFFSLLPALCVSRQRPVCTPRGAPRSTLCRQAVDE